MANVTTRLKQIRIKNLRAIISKLKKDEVEINKNKLVAALIVENGISKKTAIEEIEAVLEYDFN